MSDSKAVEHVRSDKGMVISESGTPTSSPGYILQIPPETRLIIYEELATFIGAKRRVLQPYPRGPGIDRWNGRRPFNPKLPLLSTCKTFRDEATKILHAALECMFLVNSKMEALPKHFTSFTEPGLVKHLQNTSIVCRFSRDSKIFEIKRVLQSVLHCVLRRPDLKRLHIVVMADIGYAPNRQVHQALLDVFARIEFKSQVTGSIQNCSADCYDGFREVMEAIGGSAKRIESAVTGKCLECRRARD